MSCIYAAGVDHNMGMHMIELPKYGSILSELAGWSVSSSTPMERWVYYIGNAGRENEIMKRIKDEHEMIAQADKKYKAFVERLGSS